jgi:hypothetical protein
MAYLYDCTIYGCIRRRDGIFILILKFDSFCTESGKNSFIFQ